MRVGPSDPLRAGVPVDPKWGLHAQAAEGKLPGAGPSLLLRPWSESDARALRAAIDEDIRHLRPWLSWTLEEPASLDRTRERLRSWAEQFHADKALRFAITPHAHRAVVLGGAHLSHRIGPAAHDVGYWVRATAARRGIASAAVSALTIHAFARPAVDRLVMQCDVANTTSAAFARSLGFVLSGSVTNSFPDGTARPVFRFELSRDSFNRSVERYRERARVVEISTE